MARSVEVTTAGLGEGHPGERPAAILDLLAREAALVLRTGGGVLDAGRPLTALGLDSLAAVELQTAVEARTGVALPLAALLDGAPLAELAATVAGAIAAGRPSPGEASAPAAGDEPGEHAASAGQRAPWFVARLARESAVTSLPGAARVDGGLVPEALRRALALRVERRPALRATFGERQGEPVRQVGRG